MRSPTLLSLVLLALPACGGPADPAPSGGGSTASTDPPAPAAPGDPGSGGDPVSFERLDASGECDGVVPDSAPAPVSVRLAPSPGATCAGGFSDGTGHVAVSSRDASGARWQVFAADGSPLQAFSAWPAAPRPAGFDGLRTTPGPDAARPLVEHVSVGPDGSVTAAVQVSPDPQAESGFGWSFGADPAGGSLVLLRSTALGGNHWHLLRARRFAASGAAGWEPPPLLESGSDPTAPTFMAGAISTGGEPLSVWQHSGFLYAAWLDASGTAPATGTSERWSDVLGTGAYGPHDLELSPLLDGGLALRCDGTYRRAYAHLATSSGPLPDWLAARATWSFRASRGGRAYAALPPAGAPSAGCTQSVDLLSPGGRLCGRVVLHEDATGCTTGAVDQGWDGTVVQQSGKDPCAYRWWPGLLGGG